MNDETVGTLNEINRRFYRERASEFSATRERPWAGWSELFERLAVLLPDAPRVLDIGCGNGRFARFLLQRLEGSFTYVGVDQSLLALEEASRRLGARGNVVFLEHDFVTSATPLPLRLTGQTFDLIVLFGVIHHVPAQRRRREMVERVARNLARRGFLAYAVWRFADHDRFRRKLVPWPELEKRTGLSVDRSELEPGDYLMTWGTESEKGPPALRYCHAMSDEEEADLVRALSSLSLVARIDAASEPNHYYLLRSKEEHISNKGTP
jgi:tRNA (uracil-5-)-methyltransferase TRM9